MSTLTTSSPIAVPANPASRLGLSPLSFDLSLSGLTPGEYDRQVTILDRSTGKTIFWRSPVLLVP